MTFDKEFEQKLPIEYLCEPLDIAVEALEKIESLNGDDLAALLLIAKTTARETLDKIGRGRW